MFCILFTYRTKMNRTMTSKPRYVGIEPRFLCIITPLVFTKIFNLIATFYVL